LVRLLAPQEVVAPEAPSDGILNRSRDEHDAGRHGAGVRIKAGVIEADGPGLLQTEEGGRRTVLEPEHPKRRQSRLGQRLPDVSEKRLHGMVHETRLADLGLSMERDEAVHQAAHGRGRPGHLEARLSRFGPPELPPKLVTVLPGERGEVALPRSRQLDYRAPVLDVDAAAEAGGSGET